MRITIIGLTITSSWGNGHATTYRALVRELERRGHEVLFLEHDKPWYAAQRDLPQPPFGTTRLYESVPALKDRHHADIAEADAVIIGSYVPEGIDVGDWAIRTARGPVAFYDIDTPVTLAAVGRGDCEYLDASLIRRYDLYLSFSGGPTLEVLERTLGSPRARPLYCSVDPEHYYPQADTTQAWDLSYLGTWSADRQPTLDRLLVEPARAWPQGKFAVAGPQYPESIQWPDNVERMEHCPPAEHRSFYNRSCWTLNVTRADMIAAGWSPSVRLFEAAACGTPVISDEWAGLDDFFTIGTEIRTATSSGAALDLVRSLPSDERKAIGEAARQKVLARHTAAHRAEELETYLKELA